MSITKVFSPREWAWASAIGLVALALLVAGSVAIGHIANERQKSNDEAAQFNAESSLSNCQQIETIKKQIRDSIKISLLRLPKIAYFKHHPRELADGIAETKATIANFKPTDCYALPGVRKAGIKPPPLKER